MGDASAVVRERFEGPAPLVAGRLLAVRRGLPGDLAPLFEGDDVVVAHAAVAVGHHEDVADSVDALAGVSLGEVVVAVPAGLLGGVGDEGEDPLGGGGDLAAGGDESVLSHGAIVPSRGTVSSKTSIEPA